MPAARVALGALAALLAVAAAATPEAAELSVALLLEGAEDSPAWALGGDTAALARSLAVAAVRHQVVARPRRMGYAGLRVGGALLEPGAAPAAERALLATAPPGALAPAVARHVEERIREAEAAADADADAEAEAEAGILRGLPREVVGPEPGGKPAAVVASEEAPAGRLDSSCVAPVVGPEGPPAFAPDTDCCGFFVVHQAENNCYDYGTDVATNTFAKPGRGSGTRFSVNTCEDVGAAAQRDGLRAAGTELPKGPPEGGGHYVALLIWPDTNFHWVRMDANTTEAGVPLWSHKPGGSECRNHDNNMRPITDPSQQDFAPWTQFCQYFVVHPSKVAIN